MRAGHATEYSGSGVGGRWKGGARELWLRLRLWFWFTQLESVVVALLSAGMLDAVRRVD